MIKYIIAQKEDVDLFMKIRLEMLREVNGLAPDYIYSDELTENIRGYFLDGEQTNILAVDGEVIGCASLCYIKVMPTFSHPTGKRAHLMNVYVRPEYRRKGIAREMINMLISEAKEKGVTEISLDATEAGKPLYESLGFWSVEESMKMNLN